MRYWRLRKTPCLGVQSGGMVGRTKGVTTVRPAHEDRHGMPSFHRFVLLPTIPMRCSGTAKHPASSCRVIPGAVRFAVAASCMLVALLAFDLLRLAILTSVRVFKASPHILPAAMVKMRWTRLHRSTTVSLAPN